MTAEYRIVVNRGSNTGTLEYEGSFKVKAKCWWDPKKKIPASTYKGAATRMATKKNSKGGKREGVFLKDVPGYQGIFIHMGNSAAWSDGCIVIEEPTMLKIWNDISPKEKFVVSVQVKG